MTDSREAGYNLAPNSLLGLRAWLQSSLLRLAPAWVVVSAAVASGDFRLGRQDLLQLLVCVLLADAAAGQLWRVLVTSSTTHQDRDASDVSFSSIPYAQPGSVAARLSSWLARSFGDVPGEEATALAHLLVAVVSMVILALASGKIGTAMAVAWLTLAIAARVLRDSKAVRLAILSLYEVGLPWLLGYFSWRDGRPTALPLLLGLALVLLYAGLVQRGRSEVPHWTVRIPALALLLFPVIVRQPVHAVVVAVALLAPATLWLRSFLPESPSPQFRYRDASQFWWWLAMGAASLSVGLLPGAVLGH